MSARTDRAFLLYQQSRYDLAVKELRLGLADDPDDAVAHALLALCLAEQKEYAAATDEATRAIAAGPDLPFTHYALGTVLLRRNHFQEAEDAAREAVQLDPTDPDYHALLAAIRAGREDWSGVLAAADEGLAHAPDHASCVNLRAMALVRLGRRDEAGQTLEGALGRTPDDAFTHANQGWALLHAGDPKKALDHFREALRLDPEQEFARVGMIEALKARYWVYRQVLRYFLWTARLTPGARWGLVIGLLVAQQVVASVKQANPVLAPLLEPLLIGYLVFALTTWTAQPLSNLALRLNRFGRLALSRDQRVASHWVAAFLLAALGCFGYGVVQPSPYDLVWKRGALGFAILLLPLSATFACDRGWPRRVMAAYTAGMFVLIVTGLGLCVSGFSIGERDLDTALGRIKTGVTLLQANNWAGLLSGFVANWLMTVRPRL